MSLVSWIGSGTLLLIIIIGSTVKKKTKRRIDDLDGFCGVAIVDDNAANHKKT